VIEVSALKMGMQNNYLEQHLMNWVPYNCDQIGKETKTAFYRGIAEILRDYLMADNKEYRDADHGATF